MIGIIDVGGGMRGIFGAGVFDRCIDDKINFDSVIGVSAGSANGISYLAGQKKRNFQFYYEYSLRKEYMSLSNIIKVGQYIDLDYIYSTLTNSNGENPLNYESLIKNKGHLTVVATNAENGEAIYFSKGDIKKNSYDILKASSAIPIVCKSYKINGIPCYDGGISDPVPVKKALDMGCDKIVLVLTRPIDYESTAKRDIRAAKMIKNKYPELSKKLKNRVNVYNDSIALAKKLESEGRCLIIAPDELNGINTLSKDKAKLSMFYEKGYSTAKAIKNFVSLDTFKG